MVHVGFVKYFKVIKENEHIDCAKLFSVMASERISKEQQKEKIHKEQITYNQAEVKMEIENV